MPLLPTEKSVPVIDPALFTYLLYGDPGIGKTSFCAGLDSAIFLDCEQGTKLQRVFKTPIADWDTFMKVVTELKDRKNHKYNTVVIDTLNGLLSYLVKYSCEKLAIGHPSEMGYGKSYDIIKNAFLIPLNHLRNSGLGIWLVAHAQSKTIKNPLGDDYDFIEPQGSDYLNKIVIAACDFIFYATPDVLKTIDPATGKIVGTKNVTILHTKPSKAHLAKDRCRLAPLPEKMVLDTPSFLETLKSHLKKNEELSANG